MRLRGATKRAGILLLAEGARNRLAALGLAVAGGVAANWFVLIVERLWDLARSPGQDLASGC